MLNEKKICTAYNVSNELLLSNVLVEIHDLVEFKHNVLVYL
jgi:hypothetical protein